MWTFVLDQTSLKSAKINSVGPNGQVKFKYVVEHITCCIWYAAYEIIIKWKQYIFVADCHMWPQLVTDGTHLGRNINETGPKDQISTACRRV